MKKIPSSTSIIHETGVPELRPRGGQGFALAYTTSNRSGCHIRQEVQCLEFFSVALLGIIETGGALDRLSTEGKPEVVKKVQDFYCMIDSSGICNFIVIGSPDVNVFIDLIEKGTGIDFGGVEGFLKTGERIFNLERMFNVKAGFSAKDDTLPTRMTEDPMHSGPGKGHVVKLDEMLPYYYRQRGWTTDGIPSKKKLKYLGLPVEV